MDPVIEHAIKEARVDELEQVDLRLFTQTTPVDNTPLHIALQLQRYRSVQVILRRCPSILLKANINGDTALHIAARQGPPDIVELMINCANLLSKEGVERGEETVLRKLLRTTNKKKDTALHEALRRRRINIVTLLIQAGPKLEYFANDLGITPIFLAVRENLGDVVKWMLENCPGASHGGPGGMNALHEAVACGSSGIARLLLQKNPSLIKEIDDDMWTPLHYAAQKLAGYDHRYDFEELLYHDRSVLYMKDKDGKSPLHVAARKGNIHMMEALIEHCSDCWQVLDNNGQNFLHTATLYGQLLVVNHALSTDLAEELVNQYDNEGNTVLHLAIILKKYAIVDHLIHDGRVYKSALNNNGMTPIDILSQQLSETHIEETPSKKKDIEETLANLTRCGRMIRDGGTWEHKATVDVSKRIRCYKEIREREVNRPWREAELQKMSSNHLVVSTLIATVTFAAGFTVPGGYKSESPNEGMAVLIREKSFIIFAISNTIAMLLSALSVFIHFWMQFYDKHKIDILVSRAFYCTFGAIAAMMLAFVTGTYAVLADFPALAITTSVIGGTFFPFYAHGILFGEMREGLLISLMRLCAQCCAYVTSWFY